MDEIMASGYLDREIFFQNMLIRTLKQIDFSSFFEAGCGFGWNLKRVYEEFPGVTVGGLDFSLTQLANALTYLGKRRIPIINGDNCHMPFKVNTFDVGFSLGSFMNIHPTAIKQALKEMVRVCRKYIIHIEYDENNTTDELREKRAIKRNIISHDYLSLYKELGKKTLEFDTYKDFEKAYNDHLKTVTSSLDRWEGFEGPEKYIFILIEI
jgi:ubiquinone/menaquinone biosynthesis C-methylase UbiE